MSKHIAITATLTALAALPFMANAQTVTYNNTIAPLVGSGNTSGGWTTATDNGISLSLRAQSTVPGPGDLTPNNGAGTFNFPAGLGPRSGTYPGYATWDYWFDVNTGTSSTSDYTYQIVASSSLNSTPVTVVISSTYPNDNKTSGNEFQNAENIAFSGGNGNTDATYYYTLEALQGTTVLDSVSMTVNNGTAPIPEASTVMAGALMLLPLGISALGAFRRKQATV